MERVSIIVTHWAMNNDRSTTMRASIESLIATAPDAEIIVVDNGGSDEDSKWLLERNMAGEISCYIRNRKNMHFAYARNQALKICNGEFIVIADNDIFYMGGWLEECMAFLKRNDGKFMATPIAADPMSAMRPIRWCGEQDGWRLNYRAGSNVFMMRRADFEKIGLFPIHRIAGSHWCDRYVRMGYKMALMPTPKAIDLGLRRGYNLNAELPHTTT